jgi:hypothetical protein
VKATRTIRQGEQIFTKTFAKSNCGALIKQGVAYLNWKDCSVGFRLRSLPNDPEAKEKRINFLGWGENQ